MTRHLCLFVTSPDEEELRLEWTKSNQQQHCHRHNTPPDHDHHRQQQQPAGHTGPRKHRSKQQHGQQQSRNPRSHPHDGPRKPTQVGEYYGLGPAGRQS